VNIDTVELSFVFTWIYNYTSSFLSSKYACNI